MPQDLTKAKREVLTSMITSQIAEAFYLGHKLSQQGFSTSNKEQSEYLHNCLKAHKENTIAGLNYIIEALVEPHK